jgi:hypothetical protein
MFFHRFRNPNSLTDLSELGLAFDFRFPPSGFRLNLCNLRISS